MKTLLSSVNYITITTISNHDTKKSHNMLICEKPDRENGFAGGFAAPSNRENMIDAPLPAIPLTKACGYMPSAAPAAMVRMGQACASQRVHWAISDAHRKDMVSAHPPGTITIAARAAIHFALEKTTSGRPWCRRHISLQYCHFERSKCHFER